MCAVRGVCEMRQKMLAVNVITCMMLLSVAVADDLSLQYTMQEETSPQTPLGDILEGTSLSSRYNSSLTSQMKFSILKGTYAKYFDIPSGSQTLQTSDTPLDRDVICPKQPTCVIKLDLAISEPIRLFEIIKGQITIDDLNDNNPSFPNPTATIHISESTDPGTASILPIATDHDSGPAGHISYTLSSETANFSLEFIPSVHGSPELRLILEEKLDREERGEYQLQITANDGGIPSLSGSLSLTVVVTDANDNFPVFDEPLYNASVLENYPMSTPIVTVHAKDADTGDNGVIVYSLSSQTQRNDGNIFAIDPDSGELFLTSSLDFETKTAFHLTVQATDKGPGSIAATARVLVQVKDVNDFMPRVTVNVLTATGSAEVLENQPPGLFVAHVSVEDLDGGPSGEVKCQISNPDVDVFSIVEIYPKEFKVLTNTTFDRETKDSVMLSISCSDMGQPPMSSIETLQVNILDQNDNTPQFIQGNYTTSVRENSTFPSPIFYVSAIDEDIGLNANLTYFLDHRSEGFLKVDGRSGLVSTNSVLDREITEQLMVRIFAVDSGSPRLTGTATIRVIIDDINDEPPYFTQDTYVFGTFENQPIGTAIGQVSAKDKDTGPRAKVVYTLTPESQGKSIFKIHPESGRISTKRMLDREQTGVYVLSAMATNTMHPYASATATVSIHVADKNDHAPTITYPTKSNNSLHISAYAKKGIPITRIQATDPDLGKNALLVFQFAKGNEDKMFSLNPASGEVILQKDLSGKEETYALLVVVQDQGTPKKTSVANLYIILNSTIGAPVNTVGDTQAGRITSDSEPKLTMEVTIVIIVGSLSVVLAGSLSALLVFLCRRYQHTEPKNKLDSDCTMYSGVRRAPEDGMEELTVTPVTSVTMAESLELGSPGESADRIDMWITDSNKLEELPHLDSGHGSWAESGSECGTIALECGSTGPRGYFRRPLYPEVQDHGYRSPTEQYMQMMPTIPSQSPQLKVPIPQPRLHPDGYGTTRSDNYPQHPRVRPPPKPAVPPRRTVFIPGPPPPTVPHSPQTPRVCYSIEDLMKLSGNTLNVVKNQFSESDPDPKGEPSHLDSLGSGTGLVGAPNVGSRQSSFSSGASQESKPLTASHGTVEHSQSETPQTIQEECVDSPEGSRYANCPRSDSCEHSSESNDDEQSLPHVPCLPDVNSVKYGETDC